MRDLPIVVTLTVAGDEITVDLTGSADQVPNRPINMPFVGTVDIAIWHHPFDPARYRGARPHSGQRRAGATDQDRCP